MTKRTYVYSAFLECKDGSFIAFEKLQEIMRDPDGDLEELQEIAATLTPAALEELRRYARDLEYEAALRVAALQAELGVGPSGLPS